MKKIQIILVIYLLSSSLSYGSDSTSIIINKSIDYAKSGLIVEAKEMLIELIYNEPDSSKYPRIWYVLGSICFELEDYDCSGFHWNKILEYAPNSPEADNVRDLYFMMNFVSEGFQRNRIDDINFYNEIQLSKKLWDYKPPDWKMNWNDIKDIKMAIQYLDFMLEKYNDKSKRAVLFFNKFMIYAGYNENHFGFNNGMKERNGRYLKNEKNLNNSLLLMCKALSDSLKTSKDLNDFYIRSQFLLGVKTSGTGFLSSKIRLKKESLKYFEKVVEATDGKTTNLYRIFASVWLKDYYKKHKK